jgi:hypothetical protein
MTTQILPERHKMPLPRKSRDLWLHAPSVLQMLLPPVLLFGQEIRAKQASPSPVIELPKGWAEKHGAHAIFDDLIPYWFIFDLRPEINEVPQMPTGIYFDRKWTPPDQLDFHELSQFDGLRWLVIFDGRRISSGAWKEIGRSTSLRVLVVMRAELTDNNIKQLSKLKRLQILDVSMTEITDASIPDLVAMSELQMLNVSGTRITLRGLEKLRAMKPTCSVFADRWLYSEKMDSNWAYEVISRSELEKADKATSNEAESKSDRAHGMR